MGKAEVITSFSDNFEVFPTGTDKGSVIDILMEKLQLPRTAFMAFGDWNNDTGMIRKAGVGIAMANASDALKAEADYITSICDEDGIVHALEHFGLLS